MRWYRWTLAIGGLLLLAACQSEPQSRSVPPPAAAATTPQDVAPSAAMAPPGASGPETREPGQIDQQVIAALKNGGHVVLFRHGTTDQSQQDTDPQNLADCTTQRNLTDDGRAEARAIGDAFRALQIPVGQVLGSEYCRAQEHAMLAFDKVTVEPSLVLPNPLPADERQRNREAAQRLLATSPPPGTNTIMVTHSPNVKDAVDLDLTVEGSAVILRPTGGPPRS